MYRKGDRVKLTTDYITVSKGMVGTVIGNFEELIYVSWDKFNSGFLYNFERTDRLINMMIESGTKLESIQTVRECDLELIETNYADIVYKDIVKNIHQNGVWDNGDVRAKYKDDSNAHSKSVFGLQVKFPKGVLPFITTKKLYSTTAIKEMLLFWVKQTVVVQDFKDWNVHIWNEWEKEDGTLGMSYAAQFQKGERNQVVDLINNIKNNPNSRRLMTSFWDYENLPDKALQECAWATQWNVKDGQLDLILIQRSVDVGNGLPFNWLQYYVLQCLIAHCCNLEVGEFTHQMGNVHYYDRHEKDLLKQVESDMLSTQDVKVVINENLKDFFSTKLEDISIENFKCSEQKYIYEIAI